MEEWHLAPDRFIRRVGFSGFFSLVWAMFRMNRNAKKLGLQTKMEIKLPVRWFA